MTPLNKLFSAFSKTIIAHNENSPKKPKETRSRTKKQSLDTDSSNQADELFGKEGRHHALSDTVVDARVVTKVPLSDQEETNNTRGIVIPPTQCSTTVVRDTNSTDASQIESLTEKLLGFEMDESDPEPVEFRHTPVKVDKLVFATFEKLRRHQDGSTVRQIKSYISANCDVDVNAIDREIKQCIANAALNGVLIKHYGGRYTLAEPSPRGTRAKARPRTAAYGKPKKRRRKTTK